MPSDMINCKKFNRFFNTMLIFQIETLLTLGLNLNK